MCKQLGVFQNQQNGQRLTKPNSSHGLALHWPVTCALSYARISAYPSRPSGALLTNRNSKPKRQSRPRCACLTLPKAARAAIGHELAQLAQVKAVTELLRLRVCPRRRRKSYPHGEEAPSEEASLEMWPPNAWLACLRSSNAARASGSRADVCSAVFQPHAVATRSYT